MDFCAIDVETANPNFASICQIGLVKFRNGEVVEQWQSLVDPEDYFDPVNIAVHGITERDVVGAPIFAELCPVIKQAVAYDVLVCHTHFDRVALARACEATGCPPFEFCWLDSARVARRTWQQFAQRGYGLSSVAGELGIAFQHHNAVEDARTAGLILVAAIRQTGISIFDWLETVKAPISRSSRTGSQEPIKVESNPEGPLFGEEIVFTGALNISRREAAGIAGLAGCRVNPTVRLSTTLLVVGDQDLTKLAGHAKSSKHRKAEKMIANGHGIRIIGESDFLHLVGLSDNVG